MKANDNLLTDRVVLPVPEIRDMNHADARHEMEIYTRFMRHLRNVANSRMEIKILTSIQFVADMMDLPDSQVAKTLVDLGLRAPRIALPSDYLDHADACLMRDDWEIGAANSALKSLQNHWGRIGEDRFAAFRRFYPTLAENIFSRETV